MPNNPASPDSICLRGIPTNVRNVWQDIIKNNISDLNNSQTDTEVWEKLEKLRIPGIGPESIRRTAEWICKYNDNIVFESDCFSFLNRAAKKALRNQNITNDEGLRQWVAENLPQLSDKREIEIFAYLNENVEQITSKQK